MKAKIRSLDQIVDEQLARWNAPALTSKKKAAKSVPVITASREPGTGGTEIARRLAQQLGMDLMSGQIIQKVAENLEMSEKVVCSLDEKAVNLRDDWLTSLFETRHLWPDKYLRSLSKVIGTIGRHGNAIILGRGANYILPPQDTFRVRFIAPIDVKIRNIMKRRGLSEEEARKYVITTEADRGAFVRKHFHVDWADPVHYDLILNMRINTIDGAVESISAAFKAWQNSVPGSR